ncbi:hypothetical protein HKX48_004316 [Thoreauomyces humboldtii]|nr:hypothetical protein HKX48_004316 [Thoreauomyces humboldtii]
MTRPGLTETSNAFSLEEDLVQSERNLVSTKLKEMERELKCTLAAKERQKQTAIVARDQISDLSTKLLARDTEIHELGAKISAERYAKEELVSSNAKLEQKLKITSERLSESEASHTARRELIDVLAKGLARRKGEAQELQQRLETLHLVRGEETNNLGTQLLSGSQNQEELSARLTVAQAVVERAHVAFAELQQSSARDRAELERQLAHAEASSNWFEANQSRGAEELKLIHSALDYALLQMGVLANGQEEHHVPATSAAELEKMLNENLSKLTERISALVSEVERKAGEIATSKEDLVQRDQKIASLESDIAQGETRKTFLTEKAMPCERRRGASKRFGRGLFIHWEQREAELAISTEKIDELRGKVQRLEARQTRSTAKIQKHLLKLQPCEADLAKERSHRMKLEEKNVASATNLERSLAKIEAAEAAALTAQTKLQSLERDVKQPRAIPQHL